VPFIVSLELRASDVTDRADVVLPVAAVAENSGAVLAWPGRHRPAGNAPRPPGALSAPPLLTPTPDATVDHLGRTAAASASRAPAPRGPFRPAGTVRDRRCHGRPPGTARRGLRLPGTPRARAVEG